MMKETSIYYETWILLKEEITVAWVWAQTPLFDFVHESWFDLSTLNGLRPCYVSAAGCFRALIDTTAWPPAPPLAIGMARLLPRAICVTLLGITSSSEQVQQVHAQMVTNALLRDTSNVAKLIEKYYDKESEGGPSNSRLLIRQFAEEMKTTFLWNIMLKCASPEESLRLFAGEMVRMSSTGPPDGKSYAYVFRSCSRLRAVRQGKQLHARAVKDGVCSHMALATSSVHFYSVCRDAAAARRVFDEMPERSSVSWNSMLTGYCINGLANDTLLLFKEMVHSEARSTERTALLLLSACSQLSDIALGAAVHCHVVKTIPVNDCPFIGTGLLNMYSKCGSLDKALALFHAMRQRNVVTWTAMAAALSIHGKGRAVIEFLKSMEQEGITPNAITFTTLLSACCHAGLIDEGLHLFDEMQSRFSVVPRMQHYCCVVDLLGRSGMVKEAYEFVMKMPVEPDAIIWRALLSACKIHGEAELGREIGKNLIGLKQLPVESLHVTACQDFVALSNMYALAERWEGVDTVRAAMKKRGIQNKAGYSSVHNIQTRYEMQISNGI